VTELVSDRMEVWGGGAKGDLSAQVAGSCSDLVTSWLQQHAVCHRVVSLPAWIRHQTGGGRSLSPPELARVRNSPNHYCHYCNPVVQTSPSSQ